MNYELAKQLKDAGFPLRNAAYSGITEGTMMTQTIDGVFYYYPTLSELIDACGDSFLYLSKGFNFKWIASKGNSNDDIMTKLNYSSDTKYNGKTPEEAVANLWLELNK